MRQSYHVPGRSWSVISNELVRFHDLATLFRDELDCTSALYLDGHVSRTADRDTPPSNERLSGIWLSPVDGTVHGVDTSAWAHVTRTRPLSSH